jgi:hypothetical protein
VRAGGVRCFRCTRIGDNETKVEYACSLDLRGHVPQWLTDSVATPELMKTPHDLQRYFLQVKPPSSSAASDGTLLGHMLLDVVAIAKKPERASAVQTFVERTAILRASGIASLGTLLTATIGESGYSLRPQAVATNAPAALTAADSVRRRQPWPRV